MAKLSVEKISGGVQLSGSAFGSNINLSREDVRLLIWALQCGAKSADGEVFTVGHKGILYVPSNQVAA